MPDIQLSDRSKRGYWQRPENWTTWIVLLGLGLLGFMFLDSVLPLVNRVLAYALETIWRTIAVGASVALVVFLVSSADLHKLVWYGYKVLMRGLTQAFVRIDPIKIMEVGVAKAESNLGELISAQESLRGVKEGLEEKIRNKGTAQERSLKLMSGARQGLGGPAAEVGSDEAEKQARLRTMVRLEGRKAERAAQATLTLQGLLLKVKRYMSMIAKVREISEYVIEDTKDNIQNKKDEREAIVQTVKAVRGAKRILLAGQKREMEDLATEELMRDNFEKMGEIEQFMTDIQGFITTMDVDNLTAEQDAMKRLDEWEKKLASGEDSKLAAGGSGKTAYRVSPLELPAPSPLGILPSAAEEEELSFSKIFDEKN